MEPVRDGGFAAAAAVATAIGVAVVVLAMIHSTGGFAEPLQASPDGLAAAAHAGVQG